MSVVKENANEILKDYLDDHGIKQSFVAHKMGISNPTFNSRIQGRLMFDADFAIAVSKALGIKPDIFLK